MINDVKGGKINLVMKGEFASLVVKPGAAQFPMRFYLSSSFLHIRRADRKPRSFFLGDTVNVISPLITHSASPSTPSAKPAIPASNKTNTSTPTTPLEVVLSLKHPENHVILHPDILVPMTTLAGSSNCLRKGVLMGIIKNG